MATGGGTATGGGAATGGGTNQLTHSTTTITVSAGSIASNIDYEYGPYVSILPDGRAKLAWADSANTRIYLRHLDSDLTTSQRADTVITGYKLFGLTTHADGRAAILVVTRAPAACTPCTASTSCVSCDGLSLVQFADDGSVLQARQIDDRLAHSTNFSGGAIALGAVAGADTYAVMRTVRGAGPSASASAFCVSGAGNSGHQWHETWLYRASDLGTVSSGCNVFPCGHSMFKRSAASLPARSGFGTTCISDYSGARTGFNYAQDNLWNQRIYNVWSDWPGFTNGGNPAELVPANTTTFLTALSAPRSCTSDCATNHHDVAVFELDFDTKAPVGGPRWITSGSGWEKYPHLAQYGAGRYLLGWTTSGSTADFSSPAHWWVSEIDAAGTVLAGPIELPSSASFGYATNWATATNGDVVWARRASGTTITLVRLAR